MVANEYDHTNGLPDDIKAAIDEVIRHNVDMAPKQVRSRLINDERFELERVPPLTQVSVVGHKIQLSMTSASTLSSSGLTVTSTSGNFSVDQWHTR